MKKIKLLLAATIISSLMTSCDQQMTNELALEILQEQPEFASPFYVPFSIGEEIMDDEAKNAPDQYIREHMGEVIDAGLVEAQVEKKTSWRSVLVVKLTEQGRAMMDVSRSDESVVYVKGCNVKPIKIVGIKEIVPEKEVGVKFEFQVVDVTPFGKRHGLTEGSIHQDGRTMVRSGGKWKVQWQ